MNGCGCGQASRSITLVLGLCGASNGGKTSLAKKLQERNPPAIVIIHQDDFYKEPSEVPVCVGVDGLEEKLWDVVEAIREEELVHAVRTAASQMTSLTTPANQLDSSSGCCLRLVIVEGTMLLNMRELRPLFDLAYFLTLDQDTMRERRSQRNYPFPDPEGYFDECLWPRYMEDLKVACSAHQDGTVRMLDGCRHFSENLREIEARIEEIIMQRKQNR